jgi:hypothetical protein
MYSSRFDNTFPNNFDQNTNFDYMESPSYQNSMPSSSYDQSGWFPMPPSMPNNSYPEYFTPNGNPPSTNVNYAKGGKVKKKGSQEMSYPDLAEMIRQQGEGEDMTLAHINEEEAQLLAENFGMDINPVTGLPQFGFWRNPWKATTSFFKNNIGGGAGAIIGNMILPGVGGLIGGALGGAANAAVLKKPVMGGALTGGLTGMLLPSVAGLAGSGASALGMNTAGKTLSNYGARNAIIPALSSKLGFGSEPVRQAAASSSILSNSPGISPLSISPTGGMMLSHPGMGAPVENSSWLSSLMKPKNLLTAASIAGSFAGRPKAPKERPEKPEKTPEQIADEQKRLEKALRLTAEERAAREADMLAEEQMKRRIARNKFLPEERLGNIEPLYTRTHTPEEYERTGRWLSYYNNPEFTGKSVLFKEGGSVEPVELYTEEAYYPRGLGYYLEGDTGGQDDKIPALLSDGEYVIDASTVAHLGDGNNRAGAKKLDGMVRNIRKHKGGSVNLPPKAKPLEKYLRA